MMQLLLLVLLLVLSIHQNAVLLLWLIFAHKIFCITQTTSKIAVRSRCNPQCQIKIEFGA